MVKNRYFTKENYGKLSIFYKKFFELDIIKSAQALAFISFFSIVPIYAFFFFVLAALSEKDAEKLTAFVGQYVFPEYIDALTIFLDNLSSQIIKIGAIGLPFLMLTAILAYSQIEKVINIIWDSHERRKWYQNAYILLNIVILGPFIVVFLHILREDRDIQQTKLLAKLHSLLNMELRLERMEKYFPIYLHGLSRGLEKIKIQR